MISRGVSSDEKPSETLQPAWAYQLAGRQAGGGGIPKRHGLETQTIEHGQLQESHYWEGPTNGDKYPIPIPIPKFLVFFFFALTPLSPFVSSLL